MFSRVDGLKDVEAALYVFHEPPQEQAELIRATIAAYLTKTGELFAGCSCTAEADNFTRKQGREQAVAEAFKKLQRWSRKSNKIKPDAIVHLDAALNPQAPEGAMGEINRKVEEECHRFQLERFRLILASRYAIINRLSQQLRAADHKAAKLLLQHAT